MLWVIHSKKKEPPKDEFTVKITTKSTIYSEAYVAESRSRFRDQNVEKNYFNYTCKRLWNSRKFYEQQLKNHKILGYKVQYFWKETEAQKNKGK